MLFRLLYYPYEYAQLFYVFHFKERIYLIGSAGVGRTGTFIAIDRLLRQLHSGARSLSVFNTVLELRKHRPQLVQTEEQYVYIHLCLAGAIREMLTTWQGILHKLLFVEFNY